MTSRIKIAAFIFSCFFLARSNSQIMETAIHEVQIGETLPQIAEDNFPQREKRYQGVEDYITDLKVWNPHIKNFQKLEAGAELYLDFPYSPFVSNKYAPQLRTSNPNYQPAGTKSGLSLGIAFTASKGDFLESFNQLADVEFQQNSPISIGLGGGYKFKDSDFSLSFSGYWSKLTASSTNVSTSELSVEPEIGGNLYAQYNFHETTFGFYLGGDYERFSTFNIKDFANFNDSLKVVENTMTFGTFGFFKNFTFLSKPALIKISAAKSLSSTVETGVLRVDETLEGNRYLFFFQHIIYKSFWYHLLYKQHELEGPTNLTIQRIGLGVGWGFF